jgi:hypothetical protein
VSINQRVFHKLTCQYEFQHYPDVTRRGVGLSFSRG